MKNPFAQSDQQHDGSFLPEDYVARRAEVRANFLALTLFGIVVFAIVAAFFVSNRQWTTVKNQRAIVAADFARAKQEIDQLKELEKQKAEMLQKAEVTTSLLEKIPRSVLLNQLVTRMPEQITLMDLQLESKKIAAPRPQAPNPNQATRGTLTRGAAGQAATTPKPAMTAQKFDYTVIIRGVTVKNEFITDYMSTLNQCELLDGLSLVHIKEKKIDDVLLREFEIKAKISAVADARSVVSPEELEQGSESITTKRLSDADSEEK